jgi:tRNA pseudouridine38-40 synthase
MRRIFITIEYKGTSYKGWQIQHGLSTIQGELTIALEKVCGHKINLVGSGRTDEGVHAWAQTAHFDCDCTIPDNKFPYCCNVILPPDIKILSSIQVADNFHARFNAKKKTYVYNMYISDVNLPLKDRYSLRIENTDFEIMHNCLKYFLGKHNFAAFSSTGSIVKSSEREIYNISLEKNDIDISITIKGNGFLYNMVRIIAGTLLAAGQGKLDETDIINAFKNGDRKSAGKTLPAKGLVLKSVEYSNS